MLGLLFALTLVAMMADNVAGMFGAKRAGASGWGSLARVSARWSGSPSGCLASSLALRSARSRSSTLKNPDLTRAGKAGLGGLLGFVLAVVAKAVFGLTLVGLAIAAYLF